MFLRKWEKTLSNYQRVLNKFYFKSSQNFVYAIVTNVELEELIYQF
ncbi:hypothetical protein F902_02534 [Acinetobacter higginsii]|uniref:Uncharacterized protein n=1 Tax=Acinetobacter higginsii TaxID=70347 RepID=N9RJK4_9GAMM|nr:hypothetical protein F902_02534 [Acinetobacter higginsii]